VNLTAAYFKNSAFLNIFCSSTAFAGDRIVHSWIPSMRMVRKTKSATVAKRESINVIESDRR
jgi:hypothetical protein